MIRPIYLYGSGVLREKAAPADLSAKEELKQLVTDLWDTLAASEGCGLAAPQIGVSTRVVVVDGDYEWFIPVNILDRRDGMVFIAAIQQGVLFEGQTVRLF